MATKEHFAVMDITDSSDKHLTVLIEDYDKKYQESYNYYIWISTILSIFGITLLATSFLFEFAFALTAALAGFLSLIASYILLNIYKQQTVLVSILYIDETTITSQTREENAIVKTLWLSHPNYNGGQLIALTLTDIEDLKITRTLFKKRTYDTLEFRIKNSETSLKMHYLEDTYLKELDILRTYTTASQM